MKRCRDFNETAIWLDEDNIINAEINVNDCDCIVKHN